MSVADHIQKVWPMASVVVKFYSQTTLFSLDQNCLLGFLFEELGADVRIFIEPMDAEQREEAIVSETQDSAAGRIRIIGRRIMLFVDGIRRPELERSATQRCVRGVN